MSNGSRFVGITIKGKFVRVALLDSATLQAFCEKISQKKMSLEIAAITTGIMFKRLRYLISKNRIPNLDECKKLNSFK